MWDAVDALVERAPGEAELRLHRLHLYAAARQGRVTPDRRAAAATELAVAPLLARVRESCDAPLVLIKGPEAAAAYPSAATRPFGDLDLLTDDAQAVQSELLAAGFREIGEPELYRGIHHLRPLWWPGTPLTLELHERPKWPERLPVPAVEELLGAAVPSSTGVAGVGALPAAEHALVLAAHAWAHDPLGRAGHLVDVAAVAAAAGAQDMERLARRWGCIRLWRTTAAAVDALLGRRAATAAVALWAPHLRRARERTVLECHAQRWLAPAWGLPPHRAPLGILSGVAGDLRPAAGEAWGAKLARSRVAMRNASVPRSDHDRALEAHR